MASGGFHSEDYSTPPVSSEEWKSLWDLPYVGKALTIWWRLLHRKLPSRMRLHTWYGLPNQGLCHACPDTPETDLHLIASCPLAWQKWSSFFPAKNLEEIARGLLSPSSLPVEDRLSFAKIMSDVWSAYWARSFAADT
ncbi:hypothetical protein DM01DRAFT_1289650 [Hesseltinella vesiculosa]|uniref:Reverse transcriptase zinc-binding domain-containing protein n=1 Tax=Hesseltinella vesiculosa TaxID=101127 RepID=A0A1X2GD88_9FUNG|nr:hypothetical protein DM01DRAFT_1289650 [Hesseltinella vesiculosa]